MKIKVAIKKLAAFSAALVLSLASVLFLATPKTEAATRTWDGSVGDHKLTTAANWVGGVAPSEGDELVFPVGASVPDKAVQNDFTAGTFFAAITFSGNLAASETNYVLSGNSMEIVGGVTVSGTSSPTISAPILLTDSETILTSGASGNLTISGTVGVGANDILFDSTGVIDITGVLSGSGALSKEGTGTLKLGGANTFTGAVVVSEGQLTVEDEDGLGGTSAGTTVANGAHLSISLPQAQKSATIAEPITLNGANYTVSNLGYGVMAVNAECGLSYCSDSDITLSGTLTFGTSVRLGSEAKTTLSGTINGNYTVKLINGAYGRLVVNSSSNNSATANGTYEAPVVTLDYTDNSPSTTLYIYKNVTAVVTGTYGDANVGTGGVLKGTGTVGDLYLSGTGKIAAGLSPGVLNSGDLLFSGGTHEVELGGTAAGQYDQLNVTGSVDLGSSTDLSVSLYNSFEPTAGNSFTIINNDGSDAVSGTFEGLLEGETFEQDDYVYRISYVGGTGNDVVLTVLTVPSAPDTGFAALTSNPLLTLLGTTASAGAIITISRRRLTSRR